MTLDCNDSAIKPMPQGNDTWKVDLPNKTQTYTFTARYSGDNNYLASEDTCQIAVTAKGVQDRAAMHPAETAAAVRPVEVVAAELLPAAEHPAVVAAVAQPRLRHRLAAMW